MILRLRCSAVKGNLSAEAAVGSTQKQLNSLLQNQKVRSFALSSKAPSLSGKFPVDEPVTDCGRNNQKWAAPAG
jgi:hypothetical protein